MFYGLLINKDIFFRRNVWCNKTHIVNDCYVNPHSADLPTQEKQQHFFQN